MPPPPSPPLKQCNITKAAGRYGMELQSPAMVADDSQADTPREPAKGTAHDTGNQCEKQWKAMGMKEGKPINKQVYQFRKAHRQINLDIGLGVVCHGVLWCGAVRCGAVWSSVVWRGGGVVWYVALCRAGVGHVWGARSPGGPRRGARSKQVSEEVKGRDPHLCFLRHVGGREVRAGHV